MWIDDITRFRKIRARLTETRASLSEAGELIRAEQAIQEKKAKLEIRDRLFSDISMAMEKKNREIEELIESDMDIEQKLSRIAVVGAYIKRWSNLKLLQENLDSSSGERDIQAEAGKFVGTEQLYGTKSAS